MTRQQTLPAKALEWKVSEEPVDYETAVRFMEARVVNIRWGLVGEMVWLLEHPPLYTAGVSAKDTDLLEPDRFPVYQSGRGGQYTYHGPGQRVAYVMLDLTRRGQDVRKFVRNLEEWVIRTLDAFGVKGERREGRVGIWVDRGNGKEEKIAAVGVRLKRWVSYHGIAINVNPELDHFSGIIPCGISDQGVTSLKDLGVDVDMPQVDEVLKKTFLEIFEN